MRSFFTKWLPDPTVGKLIAGALGVVVIIGVIRVIQNWLTRTIKDNETRYRIRKLVSVIGTITGMIFLGTVFSDRLGNLTVAFGVAGAGIAFALQEVIASMAGWVAIAFGRFYKTGDRILLGGIRGDVIDIGLLRTTLMECGDWIRGDLYNGRIVRIANSFVFKEPVFNYSADFPFLWDEVLIPVRFGSDVGRVRGILEQVVEEVAGEYTGFAKAAWEEILKRYHVEAARVEPSITLAFDANWMTFTLRYVVDYKKRGTNKDQIFTRILEEFQKHADQVAIAVTSSEVSIVGIPPLNLADAKSP
jgi:small-conductance mechanosensitive channel